MRRLALLILLLLASTFTLPLWAQSACYPAALIQTDSLRAETYRKSTSGATLAPRATVVRRLASRIDSIGSTCGLVPPPPDTTPPPPPPPAGARTFTMSVTPDTLVPGGRVFVYGKIDSAGVVLQDSVGPLVLSEPAMASVRWGKEGRRWVLDQPTAPGMLEVSLSYGGVTLRDEIVVSLLGPPPGPPPPPPPASADSALRRIAPWRSPGPNPPALAVFDQLWRQWEPVRWKADGSVWGNNYYDRALHYYAQWVRLRDSTYKAKGDALLLDYRNKYVLPEGGRLPNNQAQMDGLAMHYWTSNDPLTLQAISLTGHAVGLATEWVPTLKYSEGRSYARGLHALLIGYQTNAPLPAGVTKSWATRLDEALDYILSAPTLYAPSRGGMQAADGGWRFPNATCNLTLNYMNAMLAHSLARVYDYYRPDPRIPPAVKANVDYLWNTQWRGTDAVPSFKYYEGQSDPLCSNNNAPGGPNATPDLTGIFAPAFGWMARRDPSYIPKAIAVIEAANRGLYPQGSKQFNQWGWNWVGLGYLP